MYCENTIQLEIHKKYQEFYDMTYLNLLTIICTYSSERSFNDG